LKTIDNLLKQGDFSKEELVYLLSTKGEQRKQLRQHAAKLKIETVGNKVFYRGLIEYSNKCKKDCYYCGVRASNAGPERYDISDAEVFEAAEFAYKNNFASLVIQSGERSSKTFIDKISFLLKEIKKLSDNKLGITLSCGDTH